MATTPEGKIKEKVRADFRAHGTFYEGNTASAMGTNGAPDFRCCRQSDGHYGGVETKAGTWKVSALQRVRLEKLGASMGSAMVINESNLGMLTLWLDSPGWRVIAVINDKDVCTHHLAIRMDGTGVTKIENPPVSKTKRVKGP
jgi:hypothetical protein